MDYASKRGVSPVVAVILMVAVTVILSAVVGTVVLTQADGLGTSSQSDAGVRVTSGSDSISLDVITAPERVYYRVGDSPPATIGGTGATTRLTEGKHYLNGDTVTLLSGSPGDFSVVQRVETDGTPTSVPTSPPTAGLVAHYTFDSGSGPTAVDAAGTHDGTLTGDASWSSTAKSGTAVQFDGDGDFVRVPHDPALNPSEMTVSAWARIDRENNTNDYPMIVTKRNEENNQGYGLYYDLADANDEVDVSIFNGTARHYTNSELNGYETDERWRHVAYTYDGSNITVYIDGHPIDTETRSLAPSSADLYIGHMGDGDDDPWYFTGHIDEVRLYDRALSGAEVRALSDE